jgi:drug/metabolite transporter (DMT)-like permease
MREPPTPNGLLGGLLALAAFATFATHDTFIKALGATYATYQIIFFGALFSVPFLLLTMWRERSFDIRPRHPRWIAARMVASIITALTIFYAFTNLPLAEVYAIIFATPLVITAMSIPILGEQVGWRRWLAILVGLGGVIVVLGPGTTTLSLGHFATLVAVFTGGFISITLRKIGNDERTGTLMFYPTATNILLMLPLLPGVWITPDAPALAMSAGMAVFGYGGMMFLLAAYRRASAAVVAPMQYSQMLWAVLYGALFFNEMPAPRVAIGATIIIASGIYILWRESRLKAAD